MNASNKVEDNLFIRDIPVMTTSGISILLTVITLVITIAKLRSHVFKIPVQYLPHSKAVLVQSDWYSLYSLPLAMILSTVFVVLIAKRLHQSSRHFSLAVLVTSNIIGIFCVLTVNSLLTLVAGV